MQEFTWPGRMAETELASDLEKAALRREFEQHLEGCGTLAFGWRAESCAMQPTRRTSRRKQCCVRTVGLPDCATARVSGHG
jgi:hypothetical protein